MLDGGEGDDYLNGRGDGGDRDAIVCGAGHDTVVLGRNDVIVSDASAAHDGLDGDASGSDESEPGDDDGCEDVKGSGEAESCASRDDGCEEGESPAEEPCAATYPDCGEPAATEPEPDPAFDARSPGKPGP